MLCCEYGGLELLTLIASCISVDATGAQIIMVNAFVFLMMVPFGGQVATIVCVGKSMGEANPKRAKSIIIIATVLILGVDIAMAGGLI